MVAFTRRQRAYDHRLREWVHRSGQDPRDVGITVPRSTAEAPALRVVFRTNAGKEMLGKENDGGASCHYVLRSYSRKDAKECSGSCERSWLRWDLGEGSKLDGERLS